MARQDLEKETGLSEMEKAEMDWVESLKEDRPKSLEQKLLYLRVSET